MKIRKRKTVNESKTMRNFDENMYYVHQDDSIRSYRELVDIWKYDCKEDEDIAKECPTLADYLDYCAADLSGNSVIEPVEFVSIVDGVGAIYNNGTDDLLFSNDGYYLDTIYDDSDLEHYTHPRATYTSVNTLYFYNKDDFSDAVDFVLDKGFARPSGIDNGKLSISFANEDSYFDAVEICVRNHIRCSDKPVVKESKTMRIRKLYTESTHLNEKWTKVKTKRVVDVWDKDNKVSYTMYKNTDEDASPRFVFTYDNARVSDEDWDYECDSEEEAIEWFNAYKGGLEESVVKQRPVFRTTISESVPKRRLREGYDDMDNKKKIDI